MLDVPVLSSVPGCFAVLPPLGIRRDPQSGLVRRHARALVCALVASQVFEFATSVVFVTYPLNAITDASRCADNSVRAAQ